MWQVIGSSRIGTSHVKSKTPCQDAHGFQVLENQCVIAVAADGLGSALRSDEGSKRAVDATLRFLTAKLNAALPTNMDAWLDTLFDAFVQVRKELEELAFSTGMPLRDFATTLLLAAATDQWLAVGHVGDGAVVACFPGNQVKTISRPLRGEYANETTPLTATQWMEYTYLTVFQAHVEALALFTDGLQNQSLTAATGDPFVPFFAPFFDAVSRKIDAVAVSAQLGDFLDSERVCAKTDDDKTLLIAGWLSQTAVPAPEVALRGA